MSKKPLSGRSIRAERFSHKKRIYIFNRWTENLTKVMFSYKQGSQLYQIDGLT